MQRTLDIHWRFKMSKTTLQQIVSTQMYNHLSEKDQYFINEMRLSPDKYCTIYECLCEYAKDHNKNNAGK